VTVRPRPITGFALANALGMNEAEVLASLHEGRSGLGASPVPLPFETAVGALPGELPELPPELRDWSTRAARIAFHLLSQLEDELARLRARYAGDRIAILLGTSTAGAEATEEAYQHYLVEHTLPPGYDIFRHHTYGAILSVVRALSGAKGPAWMISTACTSSAKPLASAQRLMDAGVIDAAIVGGIDTLCSMTLRGFHSLDALSTTRCRPFSSARDGLNIGEAGALLILERDGEGQALLEAVGESSDAYHISAPHPQGLGARLAMERALALANCAPTDVDHVNAHGTGTRLNDTAEANAIFDLLGPEVPVVSTKGYTGHTLGAAGGTEAILAILPLREGWIPASIGADPVDEAIRVHVATERTSGNFRRVLSNSFAFGGNNVSVLVRSV
jgi:3-oxoacyl-[acyl-carrier-protein] synthase I